MGLWGLWAITRRHLFPKENVTAQLLFAAQDDKISDLEEQKKSGRLWAIGLSVFLLILLFGLSACFIKRYVSFVSLLSKCVMITRRAGFGEKGAILHKGNNVHVLRSGAD